MEKIDNIKQLYKMVFHKTKFIQLVADDLGKSAKYLRGNYFSQFWNIPEQHQDRVITLLQRTIKTQI